MISAVLAVTIARLALASGATQIDVIGPYAAQARLVRRLLHDLSLDPHVDSATVLRFQGGSAKLSFSTQSTPPR